MKIVVTFWAGVAALVLALDVQAITIGDEGVNERTRKVVAVESAAGGGERTVTRDFATANEEKTLAAKSRPKTKRVLIVAVLAGIMAFVLANIFSLTHHARFCSTCGYSGSMKAVALTEKQGLNSILVLLVGLLPLLLFYFAERGRFVCPRCSRSSTNVTVKSRLKEIE